MMMRRLTPVAVMLAVVLAMGAEVAKAETVNIAVPRSINVDSVFIVVTGVVQGTTQLTSDCMHNLGFDGDQPVVKVIAVDSTAPPAATRIENAVLQRSVPPGTRLTNFVGLATCVDGPDTHVVYEGTIASPKNQQLAFVTTPEGVTLTEGHEAVVGAGTDEDGIADAVCVKKGEKAIKTVIESDLELEAGDRLTDFLEIDFDSDTGETTYICWVEY